MSAIGSYGLYREGNLVYLHEQEGSRCLTPGLQGMDSPFKLTLAKKLPCPHVLYEPVAGDLPRHPLIRAMAPTPQSGQAYWLPPANRDVLWKLSEMIGGVIPRSFTPWMMGGNTGRILADQLTLTNCAPIVVYGYAAKDFLTLELVLMLRRTRNLILCGDLQPPNTLAINPYKGSLNRNWPAIGAAYTERYVQLCLNG